MHFISNSLTPLFLFNQSHSPVNATYAIVSLDAEDKPYCPLPTLITRPCFTYRPRAFDITLDVAPSCSAMRAGVVWPSASA